MEQASFRNFSSPEELDFFIARSEFLDAFVFAKGDLGEGRLASIRAGKHTVLYGESLFFGSNGIAGGQAPVDVIKLLSVPGTQFKEIIMPVGQLSGQIQLHARHQASKTAVGLARSSATPGL